MKAQVKAAWVTGVLGVVATLAGSVIALHAGERAGASTAMYEVSDAMAPVVGDNNTVTINDISSFVRDYENIKKENEDIRDLNAQYVNQLSKTADQIDSLSAQVGDAPIVSYQDLALSINGENVAVNSKNAMVVIDSKEYIAKEIAEKLIDEGQNVTYKDEVMYIGKIISDKADLFGQWEVDRSGAEVRDNIYDSYGNLHQKALELYDNDCRAIYNLNRKYSNLKFSIAIKEDGYEGYVGVITVKADDAIVYTSPDLSKTTEPFEVSDIPLNNCSLLKIEYSNDGGWSNRCLIYDASVYN